MKRISAFNNEASILLLLTDLTEDCVARIVFLICFALYGWRRGVCGQLAGKESLSSLCAFPEKDASRRKDKSLLKTCSKD